MEDFSRMLLEGTFFAFGASSIIVDENRLAGENFGVEVVRNLKFPFTFGVLMGVDTISEIFMLSFLFLVLFRGVPSFLLESL